MSEHNLPEKDDAPWLNTQYDGFMTHEEMIEIAKQREEANAIVAKVSGEDYEKVIDAAERQRLSKKPFKDLTDQERIQLALEELDWIVIGGQDGEEFYNSIQFIRRVLKSFR